MLTEEVVLKTGDLQPLEQPTSEAVEAPLVGTPVCINGLMLLEIKDTEKYCALAPNMMVTNNTFTLKGGAPTKVTFGDDTVIEVQGYKSVNITLNLMKGLIKYLMRGALPIQLNSVQK